MHLFTPTEWAEISGLIILITAIWKIMRPVSKGIWELVRTWQLIAQGFPGLKQEVTEIKELLQQDEAWKNNQEQIMGQTKKSVERLEATTNTLGQRVATLEGIVSNAN